MRRPKTKILQNEQGFESMILGLALVLMMGLLVVQFANLARREQQAALNKQLASQAYYAAEAGVNDAIDAMPALVAAEAASDESVDEKTCLREDQLGRSPNINPGTGVGYACTIVDIEPPSLRFEPVAKNASRTSVFRASGELNELTVNWRSKTGQKEVRPNVASCSPSAGSCFPPATPAKWKSPAAIQFSITPVPSSGFSRAHLADNTFSAYLYPSGDGGLVGYTTAPDQQGKVIGGSCDGEGACKVTINNLDGAAGVNDYYFMRLINYYDASEISVSNAKTAAGARVDFINGQAQIDSTGRAKNVLKRLQVRVSLTGNSDSGIGTPVNLPDYTIEAGDICKRLSTLPNETDYISQDGTGSAVSGSACDLAD